ncbi:MAG TPA: protocatechuate 3,4-dioxygenase subunit alpha [Burkholderiaceae bacterium]
MTEARETASQTAGPFVHIGLQPRTVEGIGARISVELRVFDGAGELLRDVLIETWQADAAGRYENAAFHGWGRVPADLQTGLACFETLKPGAVPTPEGGSQAPHIALWLVARGINLGLHTRLYFSDEAAANAACPVLASVPAARRATLIAQREQDGPRYRLDIHLQGERETVFFDI